MFFSIHPSDDVPIYEQIVRQVKWAVADRTLSEGQMLPSVRQLAVDLALNPNTIARAYRDLQTQNVLQPLRGRGMVVCKNAIKQCVAARDAIVADSVRRALADAISGGMPPDTLRELFESTLEQVISDNESKHE